MRSAYVALVILGWVLLLLLKLTGPFITFKLKTWYRFRKYRSEFKRVLKKEGVPGDVTTELAVEYAGFLKKFSSELKLRNLLKTFSMYRGRHGGTT